MEPSLNEQAIASLAGIAPFLWPFLLLSLGVALMPVSPLLWNYSTWLLFIIPLIITVFAPIRTFSGPLRYGYLQYASKVNAFLVSILGSLAVYFKALPTLALPAFFFLPVLPILFFVLFPSLPLIWHYIAYHYRRRLKAITTTASRTTASLDLAISRAERACALAHTYEKQALYNVSATRRTASLTLPRHSTDFIATTKEQQLAFRDEVARTLGTDLADKVIASETMINNIEDRAIELRALLEQAIAVAVEGDMVAGETLAADGVASLENIIKQVNELCSTAEEIRCAWVDYRRRLNAVTTSASKTTTSLDLITARAEQAKTLAHTFEKQVLYNFVRTRRATALTLPRHSTDFMATTEEGKQLARRDEAVRTLGADLAEKVITSEAKMDDFENQAAELRALLERAIAAAVEGNMDAGEALAADAAASLEDIDTQVDDLCSVAEEIRCAWVDYRRRLNTVTTSASKTTASLDLVVTRARRVTAITHTYEKQVLSTVSTTRRTASLTLALHSTTFFDTSTSAWAALGHTTARTEDLVAAAREVVPLADKLRQSESSGEMRPLILAEILFERANDVVTAASEAEKLARLAQDSIGRSESAKSQAEQARQLVQEEAERVHGLGTRLAENVENVETQIVAVEDEAEEVHSLLEQAFAVAVEGDLDQAEKLVANAAETLKSVIKQVDDLCLTADEARRTWVELSVKV